MQSRYCEDRHAEFHHAITILRLGHLRRFQALSKFAAAVAPNATSAESADPAVSRFLDAVWMERGLSANTLAAYRADLTSLARWLAERDVSIMKTSRADLLGFIAWRVHTGARPRCSHVDRTNAAVGDVATQKGRVKHARKFDIVDK